MDKPAIAVINYGEYSYGGKDIDICFQLNNQKDVNKSITKHLDSIEVLSLIHRDTLNRIGETFQKITNFLQDHLVLGTSWLRLISINTMKIIQNKKKEV